MAKWIRCCNQTLDLDEVIGYRFTSAGSPPSPYNVQIFLRGVSEPLNFPHAVAPDLVKKLDERFKPEEW